MTNLQNEIEIWKDIPNYEGFYQASTLGRIRSLDRTIIISKTKQTNKPFKSNRKGRVLKPYPTPKGYLLIDLCDKVISAHVVIAAAFLGPKPKGMIVMHDNNIKADIRPVNLKYGTYSQNAIDAIRDKLYIHGRTGKHGKNNPQSKKVKQTDLQGNLIAVYDSAVEAGKTLGVHQGYISVSCKHRYKTKRGIFEYVDNL